MEKFPNERIAMRLISNFLRHTNSILYDFIFLNKNELSVGSPTDSDRV